MYKVFFNERKVFLTDDFSKHFQVRFGLFYKYRDKEDLSELLSFYRQLKKIESLYIFHTDVEELRESFKECFISINAAGGLVKNTNGDYLLIFRRGKWDLPKGKLEKGESFEKAALREVKEECGIKRLEIIKPLISTYHTYSYKNGIALKRTSWFEMLYSGEKTPVPQTEEDIEEIRWVPGEKLSEYLSNSFPAIFDVFKYVGEVND
jgi:8-oxo-dGTP pyrophosphatase MutT (NUDIX family)